MVVATLPLPLTEGEQFLHDVMQTPVPFGGAEGVVQRSVERIQLGIHGYVLGNRLIDLFPCRGYFGLNIGDGADSGGGGRGQDRSRP